MTAETAAADHMDRIYRHQRHVYDLTRRYYLLGRDRLIEGLDAAPGASVLEVGCGTGRNLVRAARRHEGARLHGFDVSREMLETAANKIASSRLTGRIRIAEADATLFDPARTFGALGFDRVFVSFTLSMIPSWREALAHAWDCVAPGGSLHVVDFGRQEGLPAWFRMALFAWLRRFSVSPRAGLRAELERIARDDGAALEYATLYRGYSIHAVLTRG